MSLHQVIAMGNITRTPELRYMENGTAVMTVSVAVNDSFKNAAGEQKEVVTYYDLELFSKMAERVNERNYQKSDRVWFQGQPEVSMYPKKDGTQGVKVKVKFPNVEKVGGRAAQGDYTAAAPVATEKPDTNF
jgi:single-strand DNA-binding protein